MKQETKYKPFDLEKAKAGHPVICRNGREARIICFDAKGNLPIVALLSYGDEDECFRFTLDGCSYEDRSKDNLDLFMKPVSKVLWVNVYEQEGEYWAVANESKEDAQEDKRGDKRFLSTHTIELEE